MLEETISRHERDTFVAEDGDPFGTILEMSGAYCLPRCLHVVANLGVADVLNEAPLTAAELAAAIGADPDALERALRLLSANGVFRVEDGRITHTPASRLLREDHPQSMRAFVKMFGLSLNWQILGELEHSIRTGRPAVSQVHPDGFWDYFSQHPDEGRIFNAAMAAKSHGHVAAVLDVYDFSSFRMIGDIGGGRGHLLQAVLDVAVDARGILFDLPHVIADAEAVASDRLALMSGDFFQDELPACDLYMLMEIIHDWADPEAAAILEAVRRAAMPGARLLLIEGVMRDDPRSSWSRMLDIHMLALLGGRQRTLKEYETLFNRTGFTFRREIHTPAGISIVEAEVR